jgi:hypothetical protein
MSLPREIFLSHASADAEKAGRIASVLREHGMPVWYAPTNIIGARRWQDEIGSALKRCDWFVLLLSPSAVESMWVKREVQYVLEQRKYDQRITPVLLQSCDFEGLSWVLSSIQHIDLTEDDISSWQSLLRVWGLGYKAAEPNPAPAASPL